jgi:hypothetical protein
MTRVTNAPIVSQFVLENIIGLLILWPTMVSLLFLMEGKRSGARHQAL